MFAIVIGVVLILMRKRLAEDTIRWQEQFWGGVYMGGRRRYVWGWTLAGMGFVGLGMMTVVWPQ